ncbi:MAG: hypothetical protein Kapaf2KO_02350 [Candidatus Kapaibacteriales bacterium]
MNKYSAKIQKVGGSNLLSSKDLKLFDKLLKKNTITVISAANGLSKAISEDIDSVSNSNQEFHEYKFISKAKSFINSSEIDLKSTYFETLSSYNKALNSYRRLKKNSTLMPSYIIDKLLSYGEMFTIKFIKQELNSKGKKCRHFDSSRYFVTNNDYGNASPNKGQIDSTFQDFLKMDSQSPIIMEGFIGRSDEGRPSTMGFESSNLTASVMASIVGSPSITIYTDTSGIYEADPKLFNFAEIVDEINLFDARAIAGSGSRILNERSISDSILHGIELKYDSLEGETRTRLNNTCNTSKSLISYYRESSDLISVLLIKNDLKRLPELIEHISGITEDVQIRSIVETGSKLVSFELEKGSKKVVEQLHALIKGNRITQLSE